MIISIMMLLILWNAWTKDDVIIIGLILCHAADCGVPHLGTNVTLNYSSTLDGSVLILACDTFTTDAQTLIVICHSNGDWIPDPVQFTCSSFTTVTSGTEQLIHLFSDSSGTLLK